MSMRLFLMFCLFLIFERSGAQNDYPYPSLSPKGKISQVIGNTFIQIEYERPSARNRKIFGELIPWNKVWRTGAGYCTKISFDRTVTIGGQPIEKGTYSLFSIPDPDEWIIILNRDTTLYGSNNHQSENDAARFVVIPKISSRFYESLNFDIELIPNNARIFISWENTQIYFDVKTTTDESIEQYIQDSLMAIKVKNSDLYAGAAEYHLYQGTNLSEAIRLADRALELDDDNGWARNLKARIYVRLKLYEKALWEINEMISNAKRAKFEKEVDRKIELESLKNWVQTIKEKIKD